METDTVLQAHTRNTHNAERATGSCPHCCNNPAPAAHSVAHRTPLQHRPPVLSLSPTSLTHTHPPLTPHHLSFSLSLSHTHTLFTSLSLRPRPLINQGEASLPGAGAVGRVLLLLRRRRLLSAVAAVRSELSQVCSLCRCQRGARALQGSPEMPWAAAAKPAPHTHSLSALRASTHTHTRIHTHTCPSTHARSQPLPPAPAPAAAAALANRAAREEGGE